MRKKVRLNMLHRRRLRRLNLRQTAEQTPKLIGFARIAHYQWSFHKTGTIGTAYGFRLYCKNVSVFYFTYCATAEIKNQFVCLKRNLFYCFISVLFFIIIRSLYGNWTCCAICAVRIIIIVIHRYW